MLCCLDSIGSRLPSALIRYAMAPTQLRIAALPGDGIGPEIWAAAQMVLSAVMEKFDLSVEVREGLVGGSAIERHGSPLPVETLEIVDWSDGVIFGAVGGLGGIPPRSPTRRSTPLSISDDIWAALQTCAS